MHSTLDVTINYHKAKFLINSDSFYFVHSNMKLLDSIKYFFKSLHRFIFDNVLAWRTRHHHKTRW